MLRLYKIKTSGSCLDLPQEAGWLGHDRLYALAFLLLRIGLGGLFIDAGAIKLENPKAFAQVLAQFGLLPDRFLQSAAVGLPLLELLVGVGLILEVRGSFTAISAPGPVFTGSGLRHLYGVGDRLRLFYR